MPAVRDVAVLVGSLRKESFTRKMGSRPYGSSVWQGKPGAVMSVSPGAIGGFGDNHHLRQSLVFLDVPVMQQPETYIGAAATMFDDAGKLTNPITREHLEKYGQAFERWIEPLLGP